MNPNITLTQKELSEFLLNVALVRPVFIWGAPGIGKSSLVENFALELDLPFEPIYPFLKGRFRLRVKVSF